MIATNAKVGFLHTTPTTIGMAENYMRRLMPAVKFVHIYDGVVKIDNFKSPVGVTPKSNLLRWANFAAELERAGCAMIVSCCSLMPRATAFAQQVVSVPMIQLDSVILDRVVAKYSKIGVITTTDHTIPYIEEGLAARAAKLGKKIKTVFSGDRNALKLFNKGEYGRHDAIVLANTKELDAQGVDCVLMGQIPFALMDEKLKALKLRTPIFYAGDEAFLHLREILEK